MVGLLIAFQDVLALGRGLMFRDHVLVFRPRAFGLVDAVREGRWPGLTQASAIGVPLEIQLNGTWTPPTALLFLGDVDVAYDAFVMAHFAVLAAGVVMLARALGATPVAALVAAAVASLSGPIVSTENLVVMLQGLSWVPWIGLGLVRLARSPSWGATAATAVAVGFHLQGIVPVVLALDVIFALVLAVALRPAGRAVAMALVAGLWGLLIASVELMPLLTILRETERGQGFGYEAQSGWALNPGMWLELWLPSFWAPPEVPILNVPSFTGQPTDPPYFVSLYFGAAIPVALAGGWKRPLQRWLWVVVVGALVVAMGRHTPVHRWIVSLPILSSSRYAIKFTVLAAAGLAALVAFAYPIVVAQPRRLLVAAGLQLAAVAVVASIVWSPEYRDALVWLVEPLQNGLVFAGLELPSEMLDAQSRRIGWALLAAAALVAVATALIRWGSRAGPAFAGLVLLDLAVGASFGIRGADLEAKRPPTEAEAALSDHQQRYFIEDGGRLPPIAHRADATRFDDAMRTLGRRGHHGYRFGRLAAALELDGLGNPVHSTVMTWVLTAPRPEALRMMARVGIARILSPRPDLPLDRVLSWSVPGEPDQHLYRLPSVRPYVSAFTAWTVVPRNRLHPAAHRRHLASDDPRAIVTTGLTESSTTGCTVPVVHWTQPDRDGVQGTLSAECPTLVVVQEASVPGWTARVDGSPAAVVQAEAAYAGVVVPAGEHDFELRFRPRSRPWAWGAGLALLAAVAVMLVAGRRGGPKAST